MANYHVPSQEKESGSEAGHESDATEMKAKVEALLKLADASWRAVDTRRSYEWKANFGLWTALGLLVGFLFQNKAEVLSGHLWTTAFLALLILLGIGLPYVFVWSKGLYGKNQRDARRAYHYWYLVEMELKIEHQFEDMPGPDPVPFWRNWSVGSQILITIVLLLAVDSALFLNFVKTPTN